ncbi:MAG TPA: tRNA (adenosine(37)-N6)-dimethylallyltransferase MiaA, partial [Nevskiaceae bacterium]
MELCRALPGTFEIISVDSAQVYRGMDIGTAKPSTADREQVPHHLLDVADPAEAYSAARFVADARAALADVHARGRRPLFVGGTLLYFRALLEGLSRLPAADARVRQALAGEAARVGWPAMHTRLAERDPASAARIHPHDAQRIQRALELLRLTGEPPSALYAAGREAVLARCRLVFALVPPDRQRLYARIGERFDGMLQRGFLEEVRRLRARGDLTPEMPSMRAVGYRQLWKQLVGEWGPREARAR